MYKFYIDKEMLPIAPSSLKVKIDNKDETVAPVSAYAVFRIKSYSQLGADGFTVQPFFMHAVFA